MTTNVYSKILEVQKKAPNFQKEGSMDLGGRKTSFLQIDDVLEKMVPIINEVGLIIIPKVTVRTSAVTYGQAAPSGIVYPDDPAANALSLAKWSGKIPTKSVRVEVDVKFTIIDAENPESRIEAKIPGEAMDTQDKATGKAVTSAHKSLYVKIFQLKIGDPEIEDGVDDEDEEPTKQNKSQQNLSKAATKAREARRATPAAAAPKAAPAPKAEPAPAPKVETAPAPKAEPAPAPEAPPAQKPQPDAAPAPSADGSLADHKRELLAARRDSGIDQGEPFRQFATEVTGKAQAEWITSITQVKKVTSALRDGAAVAAFQAKSGA